MVRQAAVGDRVAELEAALERVAEWPRLVTVSSLEYIDVHRIDAALASLRELLAMKRKIEHADPTIRHPEGY